MQEGEKPLRPQQLEYIMEAVWRLFSGWNEHILMFLAYKHLP